MIHDIVKLAKELISSQIAVDSSIPPMFAKQKLTSFAPNYKLQMQKQLTAKHNRKIRQIQAQKDCHSNSIKQQIKTLQSLHAFLP